MDQGKSHLIDVLAALSICDRAVLDTERGKLFIFVGTEFSEIPHDHIDQLEALGWVSLAVDMEITTTDTGKYWLDKAMKQQAREWKKTANLCGVSHGHS